VHRTWKKIAVFSPQRRLIPLCAWMEIDRLYAFSISITGQFRSVALPAF